jgi:hypothetical protein
MTYSKVMTCLDDAVSVLRGVIFENMQQQYSAFTAPVLKYIKS